VVTQQLRSRESAAKNLADGKAFLYANKTKEGVKALPDGLQYLALTEGNGPMPKANDMVKVHYRGTLLNGTEFDSSYSHGEPAVFHADGMMPGWTEALQLMKVGSKWQIFIPTELAYGNRQFGRIPPNSAISFEIELLGVGNDLIPTMPELKLPTIQSMPNPPDDQDTQSPVGGQGNDENKE
jgi:FKBP-type peptidyl-prolyl cis-trans isomerase FklB